MVDAFKTGITNALSGAVIHMNENKGTIEFIGKKAIPKNKTKSALNAVGGVVITTLALKFVFINR
jgi:hypothetical protein